MFSPAPMICLLVMRMAQNERRRRDKEEAVKASKKKKAERVAKMADDNRK
jgi:hypothetical protein